KDRFEAVSRVDIQPEDRRSADANRAADIAWFAPRVVAAEIPSSENERQALLFESVLGGRDVQHFPKQYRDYETQAAIAAGKAESLEVLRSLNASKDSILDKAIRQSGLPESVLRFLPIKGPEG